jgi:hypothetical protein
MDFNRYFIEILTGFLINFYWHFIKISFGKSEKLSSLATQQNKFLPWRNIAAVDYMVQICGTLQAEKPK